MKTTPLLHVPRPVTPESRLPPGLTAGGAAGLLRTITEAPMVRAFNAVFGPRVSPRRLGERCRPALAERGGAEPRTSPIDLAFAQWIGADPVTVGPPRKAARAAPFPFFEIPIDDVLGSRFPIGFELSHC